MKRIAVEEGLDNVCDELRQRGFETVELHADTYSLENVQAVIVSGMDTDFMGIEDTATSVPVISAEGMSPEEVADMVERRARRRS